MYTLQGFVEADINSKKRKNVYAIYHIDHHSNLSVATFVFDSYFSITQTELIFICKRLGKIFCFGN